MAIAPARESRGEIPRMPIVKIHRQGDFGFAGGLAGGVQPIRRRHRARLDRSCLRGRSRRFQRRSR
jgi:hypothetical protein